MTALRPARTVHATITDSGGMLLDVRGRGRWYALTASGALWWHHLASGATAGRAADAVANHFQIDPQRVRDDMRTFAQQLQAQVLLTDAKRRWWHR